MATTISMDQSPTVPKIEVGGQAIDPQQQVQQAQPQAQTPQLPTGALQPGATGDEVRNLQNFLVQSGYMTQEQVDTGPGIYGPQTTDAVRKLQEKLGVDNSTGPGFYGPKTISALQNPYAKGFASATTKGGEPPKTSADAMSAVSRFIEPAQQPPQAQMLPGGMSFDALQQEPGLQALQQQFQQYFSPQTQKTSLVDEYKRLLQDTGIQGLDTELLNMKNVIEGTEDDIRNEITKAGGFATESQVMALSGARNKQLIKNYNNLLDLRNSRAQYLDTMMNLSAEDRKAAEEQFDRATNFQFKVADFAMRAQENTRQTLNTIGKQYGYGKLLTGDGRTDQRTERALGLPLGGLSQLAMIDEARLARDEYLAGLEAQQKELQIAKTKKEIESIQGAGGVDKDAATRIKQMANDEESVSLVNGLIDNDALASAVGPNMLTRGRINLPFGIGIPLSLKGLTGARQNFIAGVEQLRSQLNLESLISAKSRGATFGALSDQELRVLASAATKIGTWAIKDGDGNVLGYNASEKDFKDELGKINNFGKLDYILKGGNPNMVGVQVMNDGKMFAKNWDGNLTQIYP